MRQTTKKPWANIILSILFMLPLYWAAATSLKGKGEIYQVPPTLVPHIPSLENYVKIFTLENGIYLRYFMNSVMITICSILCTAVVSIAAGYGLSKLKLRGGKIMLACILAAIMIPFQTLLTPLYTIMAKLGLLNTRASLVLIYTTFHTPFCIYMMKNAFDTIPDGLLESAKLDGAGNLRIFLRICLPLTWSSVATIAVYSAYTTWNDYLIALVFANSNTIKTFNVGLTNLAIGYYGTDWGVLTAGSLMGMLPIMLMFLFLQKYFIRGMMSGALK
ncbi:carbohydrate ABC transporter permease [Enterocloster citroniae]|uniref:carbohydrate ABC transporter permease n=1 Tax=Enterocloster citroniae TaxID=358743 RepID=UPI001D08E4F8|nr:carbohydrate ABC transporter permease [Enterocloster citroniae]MCB7064690.1 carbohydrate ABC transporter permease [Enterocloster citroniae]